MKLKDYSNIGVSIPKILLPKAGIDLSKWAVVACDQYTSEPDYWSKVEKIVGKDPSTLRITLPEIYLEEKDVDARIKNINASMKEYLDKGILAEEKPGFIFLDRKTSHADSRKGLILALDLEKYDYNKGSQTLIRATEGTVVERLPPRIRIRENALIELPHIMVLIDDPKDTVIGQASKNLNNLRKVYDFELMMNGGHVKGYKIEDEKSIGKICDAIKKLSDRKSFYKRYSLDAKKNYGVLLFAMGDGNHSLATAKAIWEQKKKTLSSAQTKNHPARFALVEIVNVHDSGLEFEPIHRVVFGSEKPEKIFDRMKEFYSQQGSGFSLKEYDSRTDAEKDLQKEKDIHKILFVYGSFLKKKFGIISITNPKSNLEVGTLQSFLDTYVKDTRAKIDYIHGEDVVIKLGSKSGNTGFFLPKMEKTELFRTVILDGALPRKTFSMGEAEEKRFYLECRKIQ